MTLYEFGQVGETCLDTCDDVFDIIITVDILTNDEENDMGYYGKFANFINRNVNVLGKAGGCDIVADWSALITENLAVFREAANDMWYEWKIPDDEDDFIYSWLTEIRGWLAGYVSESDYKEFMEKYAPKIRRVQHG